MHINRRQALKLTMGTIAACIYPESLVASLTNKHNIKAIAFDGFPIFDPRPIFGLSTQLFPKKGDLFAKLWFSKIFGYTWLRTIGEKYKSFDLIIKHALEFSVERLKINLNPKDKKQLLDIWMSLTVWPDVIPALKIIKEHNIRIGFLSNFTEEMLRRNARNSGIEKAFDLYLSTDRVQAYKPSPNAYKMGINEFELPKENIAFAAFAGWDATGASWFGYPTVWVNRLGFPQEKLGGKNIVIGQEISTLVAFSTRKG